MIEVPVGWVVKTESRMDAADKRMQHLENTITTLAPTIKDYAERLHMLEQRLDQFLENRLHRPGEADRLLGLSLQIDNLNKRLDAIESRNKEQP